MSNVQIKTALLTTSDKTGLPEFARALEARGVKILSTGGTAKTLAAAGVTVIEVGDYTGFPEMLDGRVKTLHPKIHAGILARRSLATHMEALARHQIPTIELVVCNLYPFNATVAKPGVTLEEAIENIDIGGPTLVRAAAKNWEHVVIVVDPADYSRVLEEFETNDGSVGCETRFALAQKAFSHTASYDGAISNWWTARDMDNVATAFPSQFNLSVRKVQDLRYGENPHQEAAFYRDQNPAPGTIATYRQLQGKEMSYNNLGDADAAWELAKALGLFMGDACVIVKHGNPCGVAVAPSSLIAYQRAYQTDPVSAFGGIIAFNRPIDAVTAEAASAQFLEVLIAPSYTTEALAVLAEKPNVRVLEVSWPRGAATPQLDMKRVGGGLLVQTADVFGGGKWDVVTEKAPMDDQSQDMRFASLVAMCVKSNAIVYCRNLRTLGIGAGQPNRLESARIGAKYARKAGLSLEGAVAASEAFFPFRDGLDVVADAGAVAVIQPGGSVRDDEVIAAANERGVAMVFTGIRHFRH